MWRVLIFLSVLHATAGDCPDWFDIVHDGVCAGPTGCSKANPYDCIASDCTPKSYRSTLLPLKQLTIHNEKEQSYWTEQATRAGQGIKLALTCNSVSHRWEWYDGTQVDFKPHNNYNLMLDGNCNTDDDGRWIVLNNTGFWNYYYQPLPKHDIYCIGQLPPQPPAPLCDDFSENAENDLCYQVQSPLDFEDWTDAQAACQNQSAELASIHSQQENDFIRKLAVSSGAGNGVYIGATMSENENGTEYAWSDGSEWNFDNFYAGYPIIENGDCLIMDTFSSTGQWRNTNCSSTLPYVCVRPESFPECPSGPFKEGENITSPGFPYNASIPCDYTISVASGKFVQVEIEELQANSCCDMLLLADGEVDGKLVAKLSGQIVPNQPKTFNSASNVLRVSWQPNGGVNVKGFRMTYRAVDHADEGPRTTTHEPPTTVSEPDDSNATTVTAETPTTTTSVKPTTTAAADYGTTFIILTLLSTLLY